MVMENDKLNIPKEYLEMSADKIEQEIQKLKEELDKHSLKIKQEKKTSEKKRDIIFYL